MQPQLLAVAAGKSARARGLQQTNLNKQTHKIKNNQYRKQQQQQRWQR
jgi:hypothetical protein